MSEKLIAILATWGFGENLKIVEETIASERERESHVWSINDDYILKMTKSETEMMNNIHLSTLLASAEIPAARVVMPNTAQPFVKVGNRYYGLFTKLKGDVLTDYFAGDYVNRGRYLGECIAKLHQNLNAISEQLKTKHHVWDNDMAQELDGWVHNELENYLATCDMHGDDLENFKIICDEMSEQFKHLYEQLPRQVIHRDIHGENMIFNDGVLVGYIDFDLSQINARLFDLCYLGTGSLASAFQDQVKLEKWLPFFKAAITGYNDECPLTSEEKQSMKYMLIGIELIMIAFFAREGYKEVAHINIKIMQYIYETFE